MVSLKEGKLESVKIIDLGLAKGGAEEDAISSLGSFIGTPEFASPEQFAGIGADIRSALYSLGVTLWEMLAGKLPFQGSRVDLMDQHQHARPPSEQLKGIPAPIAALLEIVLAKDPNDRFQRPPQLQKALARVKEAIISKSRLSAKDLRSDDPAAAKGNEKVCPSLDIGILRLCGCTVFGGLSFFAYRGKVSNQLNVEAIPTKKSIAVLPFENLSSNKDDSYFADGVQGEILNNLAKIAQLKVISRTSVMQYRTNTKRDLRQIADALGVANVLEGTVRREGNHVRVTIELVDASNDGTLWADSHDRDLTDIFAIQSEVAQTIARKLTATLSPDEKKEDRTKANAEPRRI
jgi:TolB-like protein